jgi:hypothetical protein
VLVLRPPSPLPYTGRGRNVRGRSWAEVSYGQTRAGLFETDGNGRGVSVRPLGAGIIFVGGRSSPKLRQKRPGGGDFDNGSVLAGLGAGKGLPISGTGGESQKRPTLVLGRKPNG